MRGASSRGGGEGRGCAASGARAVGGGGGRVHACVGGLWHVERQHNGIKRRRGHIYLAIGIKAMCLYQNDVPLLPGRV